MPRAMQAERDLVMQMRRRGNRHGIDAFSDQFIEACEGTAARKLGGARAMRRQRIDDPDQRGVGQPGQHPGVIAAHDAGADHADAQRAFWLGLQTRRRPF